MNYFLTLAIVCFTFSAHASTLVFSDDFSTTNP